MDIEFKNGGIKFTTNSMKTENRYFNNIPLEKRTIELECPNCGGHPNKDDISINDYTYTCPFCGTIVQLSRPESHSNVVNIKNTYYINNSKEEEVETDSEGYVRRPLEERNLNMKVWLGFVIVISTFFLILFGGMIVGNGGISSITEQMQQEEQDLNPFASEDIVVYFNGYNGEGTYNVVVSPKLDGLGYEVECSAEQGCLSNGDTVKCKITDTSMFKGQYNFTKLEGTATAHFEENPFGDPFLMDP